MLPWKDQLSDQEIDAVIYWFQSKWPDELYAAWQEADARSGTGAAREGAMPAQLPGGTIGAVIEAGQGRAFRGAEQWSRFSRC